MITAASWQRLWTELGAPAHNVSGGLMNQLVAAYSERQRHYHTLQHLRECLAHFGAASALARRPAEVELALWFHDAIYDPQRGDNEERSADWAHASVLAAGCAPEVADRVRDLVLLTKGHAAPADDPDAAVLLDVDLAILGAAPARFDEYERQKSAPNTPTCRRRNSVRAAGRCCNPSWTARASMPPRPITTPWSNGRGTTCGLP